MGDRVQRWSIPVFEVGADFATFPTGNIARVQTRQTGVYDDALIPQPGRSFREGQRIADGEVNPKKNVAYNNFEFEQGAFFDHVIEATGRPSPLSARSMPGTFDNPRKH
jgi:hypothetical protein